MNKDDAERIANARLAVYGDGPKLQSIQIKDPQLLGLGFVLDQGVPYKIVSKNDDAYALYIDVIHLECAIQKYS